MHFCQYINFAFVDFLLLGNNNKALLLELLLFEKSKFLTKLQRENIDNTEVKWIKNFDNIKKGPVIFFGNEFFDAISIKQFKRSKKNLLEKYYKIKDDYEIFEIFKKASVNDKKMINSFKTLKNLNFIEFPKNGFDELKKIIKKISILKGCILLVDYGYLKENNQSTLQSVFKHKKNFLLKNRETNQNVFPSRNRIAFERFSISSSGVIVTI